MTKLEVYQKELEKLNKIFADVEPSKKKLVEGLVVEAAFLFSENYQLKIYLAESGMVKIHPTHTDIQKPLETARQYLKNVNAYSVVIKTLNGVLMKNTIEEEDEFDKYLEEMKNG